MRQLARASCSAFCRTLDDGVGAVEAAEVLVVVVASEGDGHLGMIKYRRRC